MEETDFNKAEKIFQGSDKSADGDAESLWDI